MLGQRRRRWPNIETALGECLVFAGSDEIAVSSLRFYFSDGRAAEGA